VSHDALKQHTDAELWRDALAAFAARDFYEVHEQLEELWRRVPADEKPTVQGLLQAAVCLFHYARGNFAGAKLLAPQAIEKLSRSPADYRGLEVAEYLERFRHAVAPLASREVKTPLDVRDAPLPRTAMTNNQ
jgi:predicted metal-dependent hydrolase